MNLLEQFGLEPLKKSGVGGKGINQPYLSVNINPHKTYTFSVGGMIKAEKLDWAGMDIAFSKQHGGLFVAKGETFLFRKDDKGRVDRVDIYNLIFKSFALKWPKIKARIVFSYELFSDNIYLLKVDRVDHNQ